MRDVALVVLTVALAACDGPAAHGREGRIAVRGGSVWYAIAGENRAKTPLLVLHGGPGGTHDYLLPLAELSDERPVVFYDQLGGGNSDRLADTGLWTIERFAEELQTVRDALKLTQVHVLGQSWGAKLAVEYAARPGATGVRSLVLSGPYLDSRRWEADARAYIRDLPPETQAAIARAEAAGVYDTDEYRAAADEYYKRHLCRLTPWPAELTRTFEKLGGEVYAYMWGPSEFTVTGTLRNHDSTPLLAKLSMPVLLTAGQYDEASPAAVRHFEGLAQQAKTIIFADASHSHHLEKKQEYLTAVRKFLAEVEG